MWSRERRIGCVLHKILDGFSDGRRIVNRDMRYPASRLDCKAPDSRRCRGFASSRNTCVQGCPLYAIDNTLEQVSENRVFLADSSKFLAANKIRFLRHEDCPLFAPHGCAIMSKATISPSSKYPATGSPDWFIENSVKILSPLTSAFQL